MLLSHVLLNGNTCSPRLRDDLCFSKSVLSWREIKIIKNGSLLGSAETA